MAKSHHEHLGKQPTRNTGARSKGAEGTKTSDPEVKRGRTRGITGTSGPGPIPPHDVQQELREEDRGWDEMDR